MKKLILLALTAVCCVAATHSITIAWTDIVNPAGTTYNVYRLVGTCPTTAPVTTPPAGFTLLLAAVATTQNTDSSVLPGTTYCYLVTAVVSGSESAPSNDASASEPGAFPPTMLQVKSIQ
jgi:hypothetical protein